MKWLQEIQAIRVTASQKLHKMAQAELEEKAKRLRLASVNKPGVSLALTEFGLEVFGLDARKRKNFDICETFGGLQLRLSGPGRQTADPKWNIYVSLETGGMYAVFHQERTVKDINREEMNIDQLRRDLVRVAKAIHE